MPSSFVRDIIWGRELPFQFLTEGYNFVSDESGSRESFALLCDQEDAFLLCSSLVESAYWDADGALVRRLPAALPSIATVPTRYADDPLPVLAANTSVANPSVLYVSDIDQITPVRPSSWGVSEQKGISQKAKIQLTQKTFPYSIIPHESFLKLLGFSDASLVTDVYYRSSTDTTYLLRYISRGCQRSEFTQSLRPGLVKVYEYVFTAGGTLVVSNPVPMTNSLDLKFGSPEYRLTWHRVPVTLETMGNFFRHWSSFLGHTNQETFDGHEPGSLLLTGLSSIQGKFFSGNFYLDVTFHMKQRNHKHSWEITDVPDEAVGHDSFLHIDSTGQFKMHLVSANGTSSGRRPFPKKYFYSLFSHVL
jgi:hypothetical protein